MKRIIGVVVAGVIAFSGVYALAASLNVTSNSLGANKVTVSGCSDPLVVTYPTADIVANATNTTGYAVTGVTVTGLTSGTNGCESKAAEVTLFGTTGSLATGSIASTGTTGTFNITFSPATTDPSLVNGVSVVVSG
jgi:hypothetical protein